MKPFAPFFTNDSANNKGIQNMSLRSQGPIMKNILSLKVQCHNKLGVILTSNPIKNVFIIWLNIATMRAREIANDLSKCASNNVADGSSA